MGIDWGRLRIEEFPVAESWAYFDHAAVSPIPRRSADQLRAWAGEQESNGCVNWPMLGQKIEAARADLARLIDADVDEIAFIPNTTHGIGVIAEGFPWQPGDNVVTADDEFPSNLYPWMNLEGRGVSVRLVPSRDGRIERREIEAAIDSRTRVLTISHVEFATGFRNDLDALSEFCRNRGVSLFVDAIQGLGPHLLDVRRTPIDFLAADGHKWLLGPEGAGFLYVRRDWIERLHPIGIGWHSVVGSFNSSGLDYRLKPSASRWEGGTFNMPGLLAFGASVGLFLELGPEEVSRRILERADRVREIARATGWTIHGPNRPEEESAIVALERPGVDCVKAARLLREQKVIVASRRGRWRVSPHIYNDDTDLDRLERGLASAL